MHDCTRLCGIPPGRQRRGGAPSVDETPRPLISPLSPVVCHCAGRAPVSHMRIAVEAAEPIADATMQRSDQTLQTPTCRNSRVRLGGAEPHTSDFSSPSLHCFKVMRAEKPRSRGSVVNCCRMGSACSGASSNAKPAAFIRTAGFAEWSSVRKRSTASLPRCFSSPKSPPLHRKHDSTPRAVLSSRWMTAVCSNHSSNA
jgi:hypothetical protein